jgi:very-short-patch-repair endonuclease
MKYPKRPSPELWAKIKPLARELRTNPTPAEDRLWQALRRKHVGGLRFRRQHVFERFIVDFYCPAARLVIEVDGDIHDQQQAYDALRTEFLESLGLRVLRFRNEDVFANLNGVLECIGETIQEFVDLPPTPSAAAKGE